LISSFRSCGSSSRIKKNAIEIPRGQHALAKLAAWIIISAMLALGTLAAPANAEWDGNHREHHHHWNGGYYRGPPVVYGSQYHSS